MTWTSAAGPQAPNTAVATETISSQAKMDNIGGVYSPTGKVFQGVGAGLAAAKATSPPATATGSSFSSSAAAGTKP